MSSESDAEPIIWGNRCVEQISYAIQRRGLRILVVKVDHFGDFLLSLTPLTLLRRTCPEANITILCASGNSLLAKATGLFDEVIAYDFKGVARLPSERASVDYGSVREKVRENYDIAIDLRHDQDTRPLLDYIDTCYRVGFYASNVKKKLDLALPNLERYNLREPDRLPMHAETRMTLLISATVATFLRPFVHPVAKLVEYGRTAPPFGDDPYVVIAPGSGNPLKNWAPRNFAQLAARAIDEFNTKILLIGGKSEAADGVEIGRELPPGTWINLIGHLELIDLPRVIAGAVAFVGNDTGLTHLASMLSVPTLCIFSGVSDARVWQPLGPRVTMIQSDASCSPCSISDERQCHHHRKCMTAITVDTVFQRLAELYSTSPTAGGS